MSTFAVFEIGCLARTALAGAGQLNVAAIFERSIYLCADQTWLCLGPARLGAGPLNLRSHLPRNWDWRAQGIQVGAAVDLRASRLRFRLDLAVRFDGAETWTPSPPRIAGPDCVRTALSALTEEVIDRVPQEGLGRLALPAGLSTRGVGKPSVEEKFGGCTPGAVPGRQLAASSEMASPDVMAAAADAVVALDHLLNAALADRVAPQAAAAVSLTPLIGLGPGLTPSGDDYLSGALIALHLIGERRLADRLWELVRPRIAGSTPEISAAHLAAAACGFGNAALHALLTDVLAGHRENLAKRIAAVDAVGHTSGWDALAGAIRVLRAWQHTLTLSGLTPLTCAEGKRIPGSEAENSKTTRYATPSAR